MHVGWQGDEDAWEWKRTPTWILPLHLLRSVARQRDLRLRVPFHSIRSVSRSQDEEVEVSPVVHSPCLNPHRVETDEPIGPLDGSMLLGSARCGETRMKDLHARKLANRQGVPLGI